MTNINGQIKCHYDCAKEKKIRLSITCLHIQLVIEYFDNFDDMIYDKEKSESIFICTKNQSLIFSIASQSEFAYHHSHKRIIISCASICSANFRFRAQRHCIASTHRTLFTRLMTEVFKDIVTSTVATPAWITRSLEGKYLPSFPPS